MKQITLVVYLFLLCYVSAGFASEIHRISLSELYETADLIVMAKVIKLIEEGHHDLITIKPEVYLKGEAGQAEYMFTLVTRGGLKDFDPALCEGDTGVFFLKINTHTHQVKKAYWGSIAQFQKNHFDLTEEANPRKIPVNNDATSSEDLDNETAIVENDFFTSLQIWRSHRVNQSQVLNMSEYECGFQKGFTEPPGLVDGSADFNLGHSDGYRAKMKIFPENETQ